MSSDEWYTLVAVLVVAVFTVWTMWRVLESREQRLAVAVIEIFFFVIGAGAADKLGLEGWWPAFAGLVVAFIATPIAWTAHTFWEELGEPN